MPPFQRTARSSLTLSSSRSANDLPLCVGVPASEKGQLFLANSQIKLNAFRSTTFAINGLTKSDNGF